jgi:DNA polymerase I
MAKKKTFLAIDGNALLHRAWHSIPPLSAPDGRIVNAAYGFTNVIEKIRAQFKPDYLAVAWDLPGKTFRHIEFEAYKAHRKKKEPELYMQIDYIKEILAGYGIPSLSKEGFEGDDVLGTIAGVYGPEKDVRVVIVTSDMDMLQLVNVDVDVLSFVKGVSQTKLYDIAGVKEKYGLRTDQLIDLKALMGDSSDNIPGLKGVGTKTATALLQEHETIEGIYKAIEAEEVPEKFAKKFRGQEKEVALMKRLVTIVKDVDISFTLEDAKEEPFDEAALADLFRAYGFRALIAKYEGVNEPGIPTNGHMTLPNSIKKELKKKGAKKKESAKVVKVDALASEQLAVYMDMGQEDLFGGSIRSIALYDGAQLTVIDQPDEKSLAGVLEILQGAKEVVGHDLKSVMHEIGVFNGPVFDTVIGAYLLSPGTRNFDLATLAYEQLETTLAPEADAEEKVKLIHALAGTLKTSLEKEETLAIATDIEMPLLSVLVEMEKNGILLDQKKLAALSKQFEKELETRTGKIHALAGREFNINSPAQLAEILFDDLGLPTKGIKKTQKGYSTAASELDKLRDQHDIIPFVTEYREFAKLKSTYVDALPQLVAGDGRIHTTYKQTIAATGRLSSVNPNLQNIPTRTTLGKEIRKAFISPEGWNLVAMDYSQFELRLAAHIAEDTSFISAFNEGADIHRRTAAEVLGVEEERVTKQQRSAAKAINFGILYGMGSHNLAKTTGFSRAEAKGFLERYFEKHPAIQAYIDDTKASAHEKGYVETMFGRKRYLKDINSSMGMLRAASERMAINMPVQGTQADLLKMAMLKVAELVEGRSDVKMLLQVHDELVFEMKDGAEKELIPQIKDIMELVWLGTVPLIVNVEIGKNWGELKGWK